LCTPDNISAAALTWQQRYKVRLTVRTQSSAAVRDVVLKLWAMKNVARGSPILL